MQQPSAPPPPSPPRAPTLGAYVMTDNRVYEHGIDGGDYGINLVQRPVPVAGLLHSTSFPSHKVLYCAQACDDPRAIPLSWWKNLGSTSEPPLTSTCTRFSVQPLPTHDGSFECVLFPGVWTPAEGHAHVANYSATGGSKTYHKPFLGSWVAQLVGNGLCRTTTTTTHDTSPYYEDHLALIHI